MSYLDDIYFCNDILVTDCGNLPHIHIPDVIQFVTFRLADSLPQDLVKKLREESEQFVKQFPKPWNYNTMERYREIISERTETLIDNDYGACYMRDQHIRKIVVDSLHYFDNIRYNLHSYVVMPNHVHVMIQPMGDCLLPDIMHSIKSFTAHEINKAVGRSGTLWLRESYDRLIRDEEHYQATENYIINNPRYLSESDYTLYLSPYSPS